MRNQYLINLLNVVQSGTNDAADFIEACMVSSKNARRFEQTLKQLKRQRLFKQLIKSKETGEARKELKKYRLLLNKLKNDELITVGKTENNKSIFSLTEQGRQKLSTAIFSQKKYIAESSNRLTIIMFDIPERQKNKRDWLRSTLKNLGFELVQKSVWTGRCKVPRGLLEDIHKLKLSEYIDIFEATKLGSLSNDSQK